MLGGVTALGSHAWCAKQTPDAGVALTVRPLQRNEAAPDNAPSLYDAIASLYRRHPEWTAHNRKAATADGNEDGQNFMPQINGDAYYISARTDAILHETPLEPRTMTLEVRQPIYRAGDDFADTQKTDNADKAQLAQMQLSQQKAIAEMSRAYVGAARAASMIRMQSQEIQTLAGMTGKAQDGLVAQSVSQAQGELQRAQIAYAQAAGSFARQSGLQADGLAFVMPAMPARLPSSLEQALELTEARNPEILYTRFTAAAAGASARAINNALQPQFDISGAMNRTTYDSYSDDHNEDQGVIGLRATIPFLSGGDSQSRISEERQYEHKRRADALQTVRNLRARTIEIWGRFAGATARAEKAFSTLRQAQSLQQAAGGNTGNAYPATIAYFKAQKEYSNANFDSLQASYDLLAAVGQMSIENIQPATDTMASAKTMENIEPAAGDGLAAPSSYAYAQGE